MNRRIAGSLLASLVVSFVGTAVLAAQEQPELLGTYRRNFEMAGLDIKIQVLQDAATRAEGLGPLFHQAIDFVISNGSLLPVDQRYRQVAVIAAEQVGRLGYGEARHSLWRLFELDDDTRTRVSALAGLSILAQDEPTLVRQMTDWLDGQSQLHAAGQKLDAAVVGACVRSLGALGDPVAFPAVLVAMDMGLGEEVAAAARTALSAMRGGLADNLQQVIQSRPMPLKRSALRIGLASGSLPDARKGELAEVALAAALGTVPTSGPGRSLQRELRVEAARALRDRTWSRATPLVVQHLDQTILEYDRRIADATVLVEAIQCLGAMGNHDAAVRLTRYLMLLNFYMEKGQMADEQVLLALVENLGKLGDKAAFDDLIYIQYLGYPARVKQAARLAQAGLKW